MIDFHEIYWRHLRFGVACLAGSAVGRLMYYLGEKAYVAYTRQPMNTVDALSVSILLASCFIGLVLIIGIYKWLTNHTDG